MRKLLFILESRSTYGYSKNVMLSARDFPEIEVSTLVTGMHLLPELGNSIDLIREDGFPISETVPLSPTDEAPGAWSRAIGAAISGFADAFENLNPDIVVLAGDRVETFSCAIAASYMGIPTAHIQAGDKSGHVDDMARMALAKLCNIHLASCEDSAERLRRLGEQEFRIFNVGAPQLDDIVDRDHRRSSLEIDGVVHDLETPFLLVVQHPIMAEREEGAQQMAATMNACMATGLKIFWIYPNSDLGYRAILAAGESWNSDRNVTVVQNLPRDDFFSLLAGCSVLVGNSSSGILEAPSFGVPVINIGTRQRGRPQAENIINCDYTVDGIREALDRALDDPAFIEQARNAVNPYGDGNSGERICTILSEITLDRALLDKQTVY